jgi:hypothetical protein
MSQSPDVSVFSFLKVTKLRLENLGIKQLHVKSGRLYGGNDSLEEDMFTAILAWLSRRKARRIAAELKSILRQQK